MVLLHGCGTFWFSGRVNVPQLWKIWFLEGLIFHGCGKLGFGKGQLSMAVSALRQLGIAYVPVIGLAKRLEEVFLPGQSEPQSISKSSPGLLLLRRVRDEAHRFAVSFQRQKRSKSVKESLFLSISGMGPKRVNNLFTHYQNIADLAKAEPRVLSRRLSISKGLSAKCIALAEEMIL